jgi:transcriptional regulator with XRE-family HTH domain
MNTFAQRLSHAIENKGLSQAEAARRSGISQQSINYIIKNDLPSSKLAPQIAAALDINPEWLTYGKGKPAEPCIYKLPIIHSGLMLKKFLSQDNSKETFDFTVTEFDLGNRAFAYLLKPNELLICADRDLDDADQYLCLSNSTVEIKKIKTELAFPIFERRRKYVDY